MDIEIGDNLLSLLKLGVVVYGVIKIIPMIIEAINKIVGSHDRIKESQKNLGESIKAYEERQKQLNDQLKDDKEKIDLLKYLMKENPDEKQEYINKLMAIVEDNKSENNAEINNTQS